ncbi:MAG: hypothetical protein H0W08_18595 [Acidobacteria bacterium]|nr:hypothetical protein [Acidobacteriota bacterium]
MPGRQVTIELHASACGLGRLANPLRVRGTEVLPQVRFRQAGVGIRVGRVHLHGPGEGIDRTVDVFAPIEPRQVPPPFTDPVVRRTRGFRAGSVAGATGALRRRHDREHLRRPVPNGGGGKQEHSRDRHRDQHEGTRVREH